MLLVSLQEPIAAKDAPPQRATVGNLSKQGKFIYCLESDLAMAACHAPHLGHVQSRIERSCEVRRPHFMFLYFTLTAFFEEVRAATYEHLHPEQSLERAIECSTRGSSYETIFEDRNYRCRYLITFREQATIHRWLQSITFFVLSVELKQHQQIPPSVVSHAKMG